MGAFLLRGGPLPLCGSGFMINIVDPSQIILPLLPARRKRRQDLVLSGTWHIMCLQKFPTRLLNKEDIILKC